MRYEVTSVGMRNVDRALHTFFEQVSKVDTNYASEFFKCVTEKSSSTSFKPFSFPTRARIDVAIEELNSVSTS